MVTNGLYAGSAEPDRRQAGFLNLIWLTMVSSAVVIWEPAPVDVGVVSLLAFSLVCLPPRQQSRELGPRVALWFFLLGNLVSMFFMNDLTRGFRFFGITLYLVSSWWFFVRTFGRFGERAVQVTLSGYSVAASLISALTALAYFHLLPFATRLLRLDRGTGLFKDPNVFGPYLVPIGVYALSKVTRSTGTKRLTWLGSLVVVSIGVLLSYSRAAWLNYGLSIAVYLLFEGIEAVFGRVRAKQVLALGFGILLVASGIAEVLSSPRVGAMVAWRSRLQGYDEQRFAVQRTAFSDFAVHPLGLGPGQAEVIYRYATHSLYARLASETGVIGLVSFLGFMFLTLGRSLSRALRSSPGERQIFVVVTASLFGVMVNSAFVDTLHWRHFWLLLSLPWMPFNPRVGSPGGVANR